MTTDITEFSQFLTSEFDNRSQTFGSFSNEKMLFLKRRMETFQVRKSQIVTSLIDTQSYKGLMFKSMSGAGFGTGVFGVVIEEMTEKRKDEASKFSLNKFKRKRIPRTYPWNIIQTYDKMSAKIQTTLQQSFKDQPRIRLIIRPNEKVYVCVTDKYLAVANTEKGTMVTAQILTAEVEFHEKKVVVTAPKGKFDITCQSEKEAMILFLFINSQKRYLGLFHFSVI